MKALKDKIVAVTGAASGIGRMLAVRLAAEGCHLAISDIDEKGLEETAGLLQKSPVRVTAHRVDVADRDQVCRYAGEVVEKHGGVDIVINNAGVALSDSIEDVSYEDFEWLMGINFWGVVHGTKAFLPHLRKRPEGHIVNISSIYGILANPCNGPYVAAKFAVRGFTETLAQELRGSSVSVTVVHPGGIKTNIVRNARYRRHVNPNQGRDALLDVYEKKLFRTTAEEAARLIVSGIRKNRRRVIIGADARLLDGLARMFPVAATNLVATLMHRYLR